MNIEKNKDITAYSTMQLPAVAEYFIKAASENELVEAIKWAKQENIDFRVIGHGSNLYFSCQKLGGLLIVNDIKGVEFDKTTVTASAGEVWDKLVETSVENGLSGVEALSLIPGSVGAAPVQNIGAYGQQLSDTFVELKAYDIENDQIVTLSKDDCEFGYRDSIFKNQTQHLYIILNITLNLNERLEIKDLYKDIEIYLKSNNLEISPKNIRTATIAVRTRKLPDPKTHPNNGSFFANPVIDINQFEELAEKFPEINQAPDGWPQPPRWFINDKVKISAGWLMSQAGFKDFHDKETGLYTWPTQSLVIVNDSANSPEDLINFKDNVINVIKNKFGIKLKQEPEALCMKDKN